MRKFLCFLFGHIARMSQSPTDPLEPIYYCDVCDRSSFEHEELYSEHRMGGTLIQYIYRAIYTWYINRRTNDEIPF